MLRAGLLSPHSKVLRPPSPELKRQASIGSMSFLAVPRDNERRKRRHRESKMLREGIGLTTGLGWSDSEDEDAPSPLTRRLSTLTVNLTLSRQASMAMSTRSTSLRELPRSPSLPPFSLRNQSDSASNFMTKSQASSDAHAPSSLTLAQQLMDDVPPALLPAANILTSLPQVQQSHESQPTTPTPVSPPPSSSVPWQPLATTPAGLKPFPSNSTLSTSSSAASGRAFPITPVESIDDGLLNVGVPDDLLAASVTTLASVNSSRGRSWTTPGQGHFSALKRSTNALSAPSKTPSVPLPKSTPVTSNPLPAEARVLSYP